MRREAKQQSYIDWLKSIGCVFYAPLTQGDITDHIGGGSCSNSQSGDGGTITWDPNEGAYLFRKTSGRGQAASFRNLNLNIDLSETYPHITFMYKMRFNSTTTRTLLLGGYETTNHNTKWRGFNETSWYSGKINTWTITSAWTLPEDATNVHLCCDDFELVTTNTIYNNYGTLDRTMINRMLSFGTSDTSGSGQATNLYAKDIYVFNRSFTNEERANLEQIIFS